MSVDGWQTLLVLGGIRSGKSEFAESLLSDASVVRYIATAAGAEPDDPEWTARIEAHRRRRPESWPTEEAGANPSRLAELISEARPGETLLVDDLGGWVTVLLDPAHQPADDVATIDELTAAVRDCAARLVLVSPEVGLSLVPTTPLGRAFADALGYTNRSVADACDAVVLVVAGQATWLKPEAAQHGATVPAQGRPAAAEAGRPAPAAATATGAAPATGTGGADPAPRAVPSAWPDVLTPRVPAEPPRDSAWTAPTMTLPMVSTGLIIQPGMELPMPDDYAGPEALERLAKLDVAGAGLGKLEQVVGFAAATQANPNPVPWRSVRVLLVHGDHEGDVSAGAVPGESARRATQAREGEGALARLAAEAGASLQVIDAPLAAPIEEGPALAEGTVESALRYGWRLAEEAADSGVQAIVLAACGAGTEAAAAAVLAATAGAEPAAVLGRVVGPGGVVDDTAWMRRCAAVRDALQRTRRSPRTAKDILAELAGGDIAVATGILLGATARRTPVLLDGPVGIAAGLISRELAGQARHWCLLPDSGDQPGVRFGADVLGLTPLIDLRLDLGEGASVLATLPILRSVLTLAGSLPAHPALARPEETPDAREQAGAGDWSTPTAPTGSSAWDPTPGSTDWAATPAPATTSTDWDPTPGSTTGGSTDWTPEPARPAAGSTGWENGAAKADDERAPGRDEEFVEPVPAGPGPAAPADREPDAPAGPDRDADREAAAPEREADRPGSGERDDPTSARSGGGTFPGA